jgi:hypothetical protein
VSYSSLAAYYFLELKRKATTTNTEYIEVKWPIRQRPAIVEWAGRAPTIHASQQGCTGCCTANPVQ